MELVVFEWNHLKITHTLARQHASTTNRKFSVKIVSFCLNKDNALWTNEIDTHTQIQILASAAQLFHQTVQIVVNGVFTEIRTAKVIAIIFRLNWIEGTKTINTDEIKIKLFYDSLSLSHALPKYSPYNLMISINVLKE